MLQTPAAWDVLILNEESCISLGCCPAGWTRPACVTSKTPGTCNQGCLLNRLIDRTSTTTSNKVPPIVIMGPRRRQRLHSFPGHRDGSGSQNVDKLAFKYMMCKVQSSTDSESEISPRWSDTSTLGCASSAPESGTVQRTLLWSHKPAARHSCYTQFLDPYDGSSEDSEESSTSNRRPRQQGGGIGGCRFLGRSRRFSHHHSAPASLRESVKDGTRDPTADQHQQRLADVQMRSGSDSELWVCELEAPSSLTDRSGCTDPVGEMLSDKAVHAGSVDSDVHCRFDDSGVFTTRSSTPSTPVGEIPFQLPDGTSERSPSPCTLRSLYKRKLALPGAGVVELEEPPKKQCVVMEEEQGDRDSL